MTHNQLSTEVMAGAEPTAPPAPPAPRDEDDAVAGDTARVGAPAETTSDDEDVTLLDEAEADGFLDRWREVQTRFVDDPQGAVRDGDSLVAELMQSLAQRFSQHKHDLEEQWQSGADPGTEELRVALRQYRSFFQRLLTS
jgi:hypothetical protein